MIERASLAIFFAVICVSTNHSDQTESDIPIKSACKDRAKCMLLYLTRYTKKLGEIFEF